MLKRWIKTPDNKIHTKTELENADRTKKDIFYVKNEKLRGISVDGKDYLVAPESYKSYDSVADILEEVLGEIKK